MRTVSLALPSEDWSAIGSVVQAIATVLTLVVAIVAARYAAGQVREARRQVEEARRAREEEAQRAAEQSAEQADREQRLREEQARPFVVVDFEPSPVWGNIINLVIENVGKTLAKNVRFTFEPPLQSSQQSRDGYDFAETVLLRSGIPAMPPGKHFTALFDLSHERVDTDLPMTYTVRVDLDDAQGRAQEPLEYVLDLNFRYGLRRIEEKTTHDVAKSLKEIETAVKRWTQHSSGVRVWLRDEDAYLARENEEYERWQADQARSTDPEQPEKE